MSLHLLTMGELALYVNRHPQLLRKYYSEGILPEPAHRIQHNKKTTRRFTMQEAERIKYIFENARWGSFSPARKRSKTLKAREAYLDEAVPGRVK